MDSKQRRRKPRMSPQQRSRLESIYIVNNYPDSNTLLDLCAQLCVTLERLRNWFNNRRAKDSRKSRIRAKPSLESDSFKDECRDDLHLPPAEWKPQLLKKRPRVYQVKAASNLGTIAHSLALMDRAQKRARQLLLSSREAALANKDTDPICWGLAEVVTLAEAKALPGSADCLYTLISIAEGFARHLDYLSDVRGERTRFAQFLCDRIITATLRTKTDLLHGAKRQQAAAALKVFAEKTQFVADIAGLSSLPDLFEKPWPDLSDPLGKVMKGGPIEALGTAHAEASQIARARLNVLQEAHSSGEVLHLAKSYAHDGIIDKQSSSEFFDRYVEILLEHRQHRQVIALLASSIEARRFGQSWSRASMSTPLECWVARLREHGADYWANVLQRMCRMATHNLGAAVKFAAAAASSYMPPQRPSYC